MSTLQLGCPGACASWSGQILVRLNQAAGAKTVRQADGSTVRTGATKALQVSSADTVTSVKQQLEGARRLLFRGRELPDGNTLAECGVVRDSTLDALPRLLGGGGGQTKPRNRGADGAAAGAGGGAEAADAAPTLAGSATAAAERVYARNRALAEEIAALAAEITELKACLAAASAASTASDRPARPQVAQPAPGLRKSPGYDGVGRIVVEDGVMRMGVDPDVEIFIRSLNLECEIASQFAGATLAGVVDMEPAQTAQVLGKAMPAMQQTFERAQAKARQVQEAQAAGGAKFGGVLKGGPYEAFLEGVTGIVGEPDADLEAGMRREHTEMPDSDTKYSTGNYGLTTCPRREYELVESGGSGLARKRVGGSGEERVVVTGTRGCYKTLERKWHKARLCSDPTAPRFTLGLQWHDVGAVEPAEGRRLANDKLASALASEMAMFQVEEGCRVKVTATFTSDSKDAKDVPKDTLGSVAEVDEDGDTRIDFEGIGVQWVFENSLGNLSAAQIQFAQEDVDGFGFADLRSTDFVEAGGRYFQPVASRAQILENVALAQALSRKTEFMQHEWDAFRIRGLSTSHLVKVGDSYFQPAGTEEQVDVRVLRPLEYYGNFADDGRLIDPAPNDADTPVQRTIKEAGLRRVEVKAVILYTGPGFTLYNSILRGFGACGEVAAGVEFGSEQFWKQFREVSIEEWVKKSGHRFTNTIHALASAIKKLQRLSQDAQGTLLWRGLDGLDVAEFLAGCGFTDRAFMSTTKDRRTAMQYSGVTKGLVGTVLCIETSTTNNGAEITAFSQYPSEAETVWGACCFLQHRKGRTEIVLPVEGGIIKIFHVLCSANSKALTVEELEARRKRVVAQVLDTLHNDVCRAADTAAASPEFEARVEQDRCFGFKDHFIESIKDESAARVAVYKALPDLAFAEIETLGEALSQGLALPLLARAKLRLWLEDPELNLGEMGNQEWAGSDYLGFNAAKGRRLARRRLRLQESAGDEATATLALEDCQERRLVTGGDAAALERKDLFSGETPLITQIQLGELENAQRLLQAGADANAATAGGERPLLMAAKEGRDDLVELLAVFGAEVDVRDAKGKTALHHASFAGHSAVVQSLVKLGADAALTDKDGGTALSWACAYEHEAAAAELMEATKLGGALDLQDNGGYGKRSALHWASAKGMVGTVAKLLSLGADVALANKNGDTPLEDACQDAYEEVKAAFAEHAAKGGETEQPSG